jgi:hypothetical protein
MLAFCSKELNNWNMVRFPDPGLLVAEQVRPKGERPLDQIAARILGAPSIGNIAANEIRATLLSFRDSRRPNTVLGALAARDGQSIEEVQSRLGNDIHEADTTLDALEMVGLVDRTEDDGITRFKLTERPLEQL